MSGHAPPVGLSEQDFEIIEDAVMETARGRWFLREYARRMRSADTARLLDAMARLERIVMGQPAEHASGSRVDHFAGALETRGARLSQLAISLREQGYDGDLCGRIAREAEGLADLAEEMRGEEPPSEAPASGRAEKLDRWPEDEDPHASAVVTIDAEVLPAADHGSDLSIVESEPCAMLDLGALAPIDSLPFRDKLTLFS